MKGLIKKYKTPPQRRRKKKDLENDENDEEEDREEILNKDGVGIDNNEKIMLNANHKIDSKDSHPLFNKWTKVSK